MTIKFSRPAAKFLDKITEKDKERIRQKIKTLVLSIENQGIIPFRELDIKKLSGEWSEFLRMRIGGMRVIFRIDHDKDEFLVYEIDFRGGVYKK
jgi:mRNA interferase RelE/StbE